MSDEQRIADLEESVKDLADALITIVKKTGATTPGKAPDLDWHAVEIAAERAKRRLDR
jgi:hypothetical protein